MISLLKRNRYQRLRSNPHATRPGLFKKLLCKLPKLTGNSSARTPPQPETPAEVTRYPSSTSKELSPLVALHRAAALDALNGVNRKPHTTKQAKPAILALYAVIEEIEGKEVESTFGGLCPSFNSSDDYDPDAASVVTEELFFNYSRQAHRI
ncbi:hypothetical protein FRC03_002007 [Tulasnella sp. 419]|nr:hypothetical protein FRC03_002007 [Tulasnella sp. 419]